MKNADYWRGRFAILENSAHKQADEYLQTLEDIYREAEQSVQRDIESWYQRFATNNKVTLAEARKMLTTGQLEEFKWTAEQYVKAAQRANLSEDWIKKLENGYKRDIGEKALTKESQKRLQQAIKEKRITAEACVPHLLFCDRDYTTFGARIKCNPSIKTPEDRDALRKALSGNRIDVIGTDHAPHLLHEKEGGALKAVSGIPFIQFSLVSIFELVKDGILTIEQLVQKMCHAPAELYNIEKRGYIRPGYRADLVILNPKCEWEVTADCIESKCGWSPMEGKIFHSRIEKTFVNGTVVYENGTVNKNNRGQALVFER